MYTISIPNLIVDQEYIFFEECHQNALYIVNNTPGVKFACVYENKNLMTVLIKKGYGVFNFQQFNTLEIHDKINDFFILHQNGKDNYYIKLKTKKK
jgi:hypothetical protein